MNEGGGVQRLARFLMGKTLSCQFAQFVVDEREEFGRGVGIAGLYGRKDLRNVRHTA